MPTAAPDTLRVSTAVTLAMAMWRIPFEFTYQLRPPGSRMTTALVQIFAFRVE